MKDFRFLAKIYGVRGSYPIAPKGGTKIGGNTTCLLLRTPNHIVIIDAGSGLIVARSFASARCAASIIGSHIIVHPNGAVLRDQ